MYLSDLIGSLEDPRDVAVADARHVVDQLRPADSQRAVDKVSIYQIKNFILKLLKMSITIVFMFF